MWDLPFGYRLALAAALLIVASGVEFACKGPGAVRWRGTLIIMAGAMCGGAFGIAVDSITSAISPAYFAVGKGLGWGDDLTHRARVLGLQAGCSAGVVIACVLTYFNFRVTPGAAPLPILRVVRSFAGLALASLCGAVALALVFLACALGDVGLGVPMGVASEEREPFLLVWGAHTGLYAGGLAGLIRASVRLREHRRIR